MRKINKTIFYMILIFVVLFYVVLFTPLIFESFKSNQEYYYSGIYELPKSFFNFENYLFVITEGKLLSSMLTSMLIVFLVVICTSLLNGAQAYVIERFDFKFKKIYVLTYTFVALIPMILLQITLFKIFNLINLYNTIFGVVLLYSFIDIISFYVLRDNINKISTDIDEAALIDGCSYITIFFKIIVPNLVPSFIIIFILKTVIIFNDFYIQYLYLPTKNTLSTILYSFIQPYDINDQAISASLVITMLISVVFVLLVLIGFKKYNE